jgi:PleD family two-component response regulator
MGQRTARRADNVEKRSRFAIRVVAWFLNSSEVSAWRRTAMLTDTVAPARRSDEAVRVSSLSGTGPTQKVVIVNGSPEVLAIVESAVEAGHYGIVFIESVEHAYTQIKRVQPNLVILCLRLGDALGFQVLSMLKLDDATRSIPVITYAAEEQSAAESEPEEEQEEPEPTGVPLFDRGAAEIMN